MMILMITILRISENWNLIESQIMHVSAQGSSLLWLPSRDTQGFPKVTFCDKAVNFFLVQNYLIMNDVADKQVSLGN